MNEEELTTMTDSENGADEASGDITGWESVAALQDKMGKLREEDDPTRKELMDFLKKAEH